MSWLALSLLLTSTPFALEGEACAPREVLERDGRTLGLALVPAASLVVRLERRAALEFELHVARDGSEVLTRTLRGTCEEAGAAAVVVLERLLRDLANARPAGSASPTPRAVVRRPGEADGGRTAGTALAAKEVVRGSRPRAESPGSGATSAARVRPTDAAGVRAPGSPSVNAARSDETASRVLPTDAAAVGAPSSRPVSDASPGVNDATRGDDTAARAHPPDAAADASSSANEPARSAESGARVRPAEVAEAARVTPERATSPSSTAAASRARPAEGEAARVVSLEPTRATSTSSARAGPSPAVTSPLPVAPSGPGFEEWQVLAGGGVIGPTTGVLSPLLAVDASARFGQRWRVGARALFSFGSDVSVVDQATSVLRGVLSTRDVWVLLAPAVCTDGDRARVCAGPYAGLRAVIAQAAGPYVFQTSLRVSPAFTTGGAVDLTLAVGRFRAVLGASVLVTPSPPVISLEALPTTTQGSVVEGFATLTIGLAGSAP